MAVSIAAAMTDVTTDTITLVTTAAITAGTIVHHNLAEPMCWAQHCWTLACIDEH